MPATPQDKVVVACPRCGHEQPEPRTGFSTICRSCRQHFRLQEALSPARDTPRAAPRRRRITCFECGTELDVPTTAESTMCKRCSRYVDLKDYHIGYSISKNFKTKGLFEIEPKGYVFNTETLAGDVILKGRLLGKLRAERSLTIFSSAQIKGTFTAGLLVIPAENHFRWKDPIRVDAAEIAGEVVADLNAKGTVALKSSAVFFGNIAAGNLAIEPGAVLVGALSIGHIG